MDADGVGSGKDDAEYPIESAGLLLVLLLKFKIVYINFIKINLFVYYRALMNAKAFSGSRPPV